jgi:hypothetical protein
MEKTKLKKSKTLSINTHEIESKAFSKSMRRRIPVFRTINYGYKTGQLSITQKQGIITCIPKGEKPRKFMKNWKPISLLNTVYKLASSCIAERIKSVLPILTRA